ncbi:PEP-CTERM motif protein [Aquisphaera giovannonii]|uniref:PEP-CTERM motif protein n=1 Tax=Aquisphaera giovannonii TaxID=406548 RepID=A0A5B9VUU1_9BACT|nr:PEP-CTERM sorting domain-containing protein [Aquisphaera giovannonii]QEH31647.1 PEP-CTERM motif protein [Aquisphaera giovannonii]
MTKTFTAALLAAVVLLAGSVSPARAGFLTSLDVLITPQAGNSYLYEYTLTVGAASDRPAASLVIDVSTVADLTALTGPTGWDITYAAGDSFVAWDSPAEDLELAVGASAVFSFVSSLAPGLSDYQVAGIGTNPLLAFNTGQVGAPVAAVPEPASLAMLASGALGVLLHILIRRRVAP